MRANSILDYMIKYLDSTDDETSVCSSKRARLDLTVGEVIMLEKTKAEVNSPIKKEPKEEPIDEDEIIWFDDEEPERCDQNIFATKEAKKETKTEPFDAETDDFLIKEDEECWMNVSDCESTSQRDVKPEITQEDTMAKMEDDEDDDCMIILYKEGEGRQNFDEKIPIGTSEEDRIVKEKPDSAVEAPEASSTPPTAPAPVSSVEEKPAPLPDTRVSLSSILLEKSQLPRKVYPKNHLARRAGGPPRDTNGRVLPPLPFIGRKRDANGKIRTLASVGNKPGLSSGLLPPLPSVENAPEMDATPELLPISEDISPVVDSPPSTPGPSFGDISDFEPLSSEDEETPASSESTAAASSSRRKDKTKAIPSRLIKQMKIKEKEKSIPRTTMLKIIKEISDEITADNNTSSFKWQSSAVDAIHEAAEIYTTCFFEDANLLALHARRVTVSIQDIRLLGMIRRRTMESDKIFSSIKL